MDTDKWMESGKNVQYTGYTTLDQDTERKYARDITKNKFKILVEQHSHPLVKREIADLLNNARICLFNTHTFIMRQAGRRRS